MERSQLLCDGKEQVEQRVLRGKLHRVTPRTQLTSFMKVALTSRFSDSFAEMTEG